MENKDKLNQNQVAQEDNKWMEKRNRNSTRQEESAKKHGDKNSESQNSNSNKNKEKRKHVLEDEERFGLDAEFADPTETNKDYLQQPQPMSDNLRSIYAGAPGKGDDHRNPEKIKKEQNEQSSERRKNLEQADYAADDVGTNKSEEDIFLDTERGNYSQHNDYQDRQGYNSEHDLEEEFPGEERNRYSKSPTGNKDSNESANFADGEDKIQKSNTSGNEASEYPSALQNSWDDSVANPKGYGETDYDDKEIRRKQDEGQQPWEESDKDDEDV